MPIASDVSTGGRKAEVDRDIIAAAAGSRPTTSTVSRPAPLVSQGDHLRGPEHPANSSGHTNPVPANLFAPQRDALLERAKEELAMRAGALTTVPEVEAGSTGVPAWDAAIARHTGGGMPTVQTPSYGAGARAGIPSVDLADEHRTAAAEAASDAASRERSDKRATRKGLREGGTNQRQRAMTADEFAALSPRQKAAVELTSMLAAAAEADRQVGHGPTGKPATTEDGIAYQATVEEMFGGDATDMRYAPNTVEVLRNIGWTGEDVNLNDIVKGKLGFTRQDLADLERPENKTGTDARLNTSAKMRDDLQASLVKAFAASRKEAVTGENLLEGKRTLLGYDELPGFASGKSREVAPGVDLNTYIRKAFDILADSNSQYEPQQVLDQAKVTLSDEEFQAFLNFVDINSRESKNYRQPLGNTEGQTYFDPVEFRQSIAKELREERGRARSR
jgi:hypothetical protein